jgi:hypothetical protein
LLGRLVGQKLGDVLSRSLKLRCGWRRIGAAMVAKAAPDGYAARLFPHPVRWCSGSRHIPYDTLRFHARDPGRRNHGGGRGSASLPINTLAEHRIRTTELKIAYGSSALAPRTTSRECGTAHGRQMLHVP